MPLPSGNDIASLKFCNAGRPIAILVGRPTTDSNLRICNAGAPVAINSFPQGDLYGVATGSVSITANLQVVYQASTSITDSVSITTEMNQMFATASGSVNITANLRLSTAVFYNDYTVQVQIPAAVDNDYSTTIALGAAYENDYTVQTSIVVDDLVPVTDYTNPSNPFLPSIISNGQVVIENSATNSELGGDISNISLYISMLNAGMTNCSLCDLEGLTFNLGDSGGSWSVNSLCGTLGGCNSTVELYGLAGAIGDHGLTLSSNQASFNYSGIFGNPNLQRPFQWTMAGTLFFGALANPLYAGPPTQTWPTIQAAAFAIMLMTGGGSIQWLVRDYPLSNFTLQEGQTAMEALTSLASMAGGKLRWNGNNSWIVCYPDYSKGVFNIPSCDLIMPGGVTQVNHCNIQNDYIIAGSSPNQTPATNKTLPAGAQPAVNLLNKFSKRLQADDPPYVYDLPPNFDQVYAQILVSSSYSTLGANLVDPVNNYMTYDPEQYFEFNPAYLGVEYVFVANIGGVPKNQVQVDYRCLPAQAAGNQAIENEKFVFSLYYTTKPLEAPANPNNLLGLTQDNFRFVKVTEYQVQVLFFGSIPMPGMLLECVISGIQVFTPDPNSTSGYTTINLPDINTSGAIIDSVSFQFPGYMTINATVWQRLYFYSSIPIQYSPSNP